jgi:hypothetical protein
MQISLSIEERPPVLRNFLAELQNALGGDARVWASMVAGNEAAPQQIYAFVQVFEARSADAALRRVQPAIREADPEMRIVKGDPKPLGDPPMPVETDVRAHEPDTQQSEPTAPSAIGSRATAPDRPQQFQLL